MRYQDHPEGRCDQDIKAMKEELEKIRERALEVFAHYEKTKAAIREEVRKEYTRTIRHLENERTHREGIIKENIARIDKLQNKIESMRNEILGLETKSKLWEHECARICDIYHRTIGHYSNPGLIEVQLQVISEYTDALIRFVKVHMWGKDTLDMAHVYRESITKKMRELVLEIEKCIKEDISPDSAGKNVSALSEKTLHDPA